MRGNRWAAWIGAAAGLALSIAVAAIALRPDPVPAPPDPAAPEPAAPVAGLPSGQEVTLHEAIFEPTDGGAYWLRLRFVAPLIGEGEGQVGFEQAEPDMRFLCREVGLPVIARSGREVPQVVVSLAQAPTVFGQQYPDVVQYFGAFRTDGGDCIWEEF